MFLWLFLFFWTFPPPGACVRIVLYTSSNSSLLGNISSPWLSVLHLPQQDTRPPSPAQLTAWLCAEVHRGTDVLVLWRVAPRVGRLIQALSKDTPLMLITVEEASYSQSRMLGVRPLLTFSPQEDILKYFFHENLAEPLKTALLLPKLNEDWNQHHSDANQLQECGQSSGDWLVCQFPKQESSLVRLLIGLRRKQVEHMLFLCDPVVVYEVLSVVDSFGLQEDFSTFAMLCDSQHSQEVQNNGNDTLWYHMKRFSVLLLTMDTPSSTEIAHSFMEMLLKLRLSPFTLQGLGHEQLKCGEMPQLMRRSNELKKRKWRKAIESGYSKWLEEYFLSQISARLQPSWKPVVSAASTRSNSELKSKPPEKGVSTKDITGDGGGGRQVVIAGAVPIEPFVIVESTKKTYATNTKLEITKSFINTGSKPANVPPLLPSRSFHSEPAACVQQVRCIRFRNSTVPLRTIQQVVAEQRHSHLLFDLRPTPGAEYDYVCCHGISVTLLAKLASDLSFELVLYEVPAEILMDHAEGVANREEEKHLSTVERTALNLLHYSNFTDLLVGALSPSRYLSGHVLSSHPFFLTSLGYLMHYERTESFLGAVFQPFYLEVWFSILLCGTVVATIMALYEWNSPFGLNPWGRKRRHLYTLASAANSVWAMLFGHTIRTKAPKSWPVKVLQNFWACACIAVVAMYTANLTVFLTGIADSKMEVKINQQPLVMRSGSAVHSRMWHHMHSDAHTLRRANKRLVSTLRIAEQLFLNKNATIFVEERAILEYFRESYGLCEARLKTLDLGLIQYSFLLSRGDKYLEEQMSQMIVKYDDSGYLEFLRSNYYGRQSICNAKNAIPVKDKSHKGYSPANLAGLFVVMGVGLVVALSILTLEHILFKWMVPYWRALPESSRWKRSNKILFLSQRLHRIIHSERLIQPTEYTREMLEIVKKRQFSKIFQKENIIKPLPPTHRESLAKISVFDISHEVIKNKKSSMSEESSTYFSSRRGSRLTTSTDLGETGSVETETFNCSSGNSVVISNHQPSPSVKVYTQQRRKCNSISPVPTRDRHIVFSRRPLLLKQASFYLPSGEISNPSTTSSNSTHHPVTTEAIPESSNTGQDPANNFPVPPPASSPADMSEIERLWIAQQQQQHPTGKVKRPSEPKTVGWVDEMVSNSKDRLEPRRPSAKI